MPPSPDEVAYIQGRLEVVHQQLVEMHRENREDHQTFFQRLDKIERQPVIVLGEELQGICRSILGTAVIALIGWALWLYKIH